MDLKAVMDSNVVAAMVTIVGALVTVLIGIGVHDRQARDATRIEHALSAYGDYIEAVAAVAATQRRMRSLPEAAPDRKEAERAVAEALADVTAAKGLFALYGDGPVVEALSRVDGDLGTPEGMSSFLAAVEAIRSYVGADSIPRKHLDAILFGS